MLENYEGTKQIYRYTDIHLIISKYRFGLFWTFAIRSILYQTEIQEKRKIYLNLIKPFGVLILV